MNEPHRWRSPLLGESHQLSLPQGTVEYFRRGSGKPLIFAHGWLANANLWRHVVDLLAGRFECIALDLPFGAHRIGLEPDADLSAEGCGALIAAALDALGLENVTLVGNDSGGAYSQIALAAGAEGVERLVLTSCETPYDQFPPEPFDGKGSPLSRTPRSASCRSPSASWSSTPSTGRSRTPTRSPARAIPSSFRTRRR